MMFAVQLVSLGIMFYAEILLEYDAQESWVKQICTVAVAKWALDTASLMVKWIADSAPRSYFKDILDRAYVPEFQAP